MTIKRFAQLCACNMQTLRYYDRIGLLKPAKVDPGSGYRHYGPAQAVTFVKIKNLQAADFSISEIKELLAKSDQEVYAAFDRKIAQQEEKLERIRKIQRSYLTEKSMMEKIVHSMTEYLLSQCAHPEVLTEFGLSVSDAPAILELLKGMMNQHVPQEAMTMTVNGEVIREQGAILDRIHSLTKENITDTVLLSSGLGHDMETDADADPDFSDWEVAWEQRGWAHVYEFIDAIPQLEPGARYCLRVWKQDASYDDDLSYPLFLVGTVLQKQRCTEVTLGCAMSVAEDRENRFQLLRQPLV